MGLTDFAIRQTKATGRPYTLGDSDGLSLAISAQENSFEAIYQQWLTHRRLELQDGRQGTLEQMQVQPLTQNDTNVCHGNITGPTLIHEDQGKPTHSNLLNESND